jgi:8-oxo-dGTP diphosphatase
MNYRKTWFFIGVILLCQKGLEAMFEKSRSPLKLVGVGNMLIQDDKILLVLRDDSIRNGGMYGLIGGLIEAGESVRQGAIREIEEEIGVIVVPQDMELVHTMSSIESDEGEVVGHYFVVKKWQGVPFNKEPHKHLALEWFNLNQLPENIIFRNKQAIEMMQKGISYSEYGWSLF